MLRSFDDVSPITIRSNLKPPLHAEWSNSRKLLAIAGTKESEHVHPGSPQEYTNLLKFYSVNGTLVYTTEIPYTQCPVSALTWGHNDRRLFVATGARIHAAWVSRCSVPEPRELRRFVSRPPPGGSRLHCTMLRHAIEPVPCYTLYLEYLGGLVPLLKGRRTSKIRPEFVIFDPQSQETLQVFDDMSQCPSYSDGSDTEKDTADLCGSPRYRKKNRKKRDEKPSDEATEREEKSNDLAYVDTLPEHARLVEVTSNIWGTKFKFHGLADSIPANLGQVTYRTSLLHLQPRQMTLVMTELRDDLPAGPDPTFNPNLFSEDEEEPYQEASSRATPEAQPPPIAPMTPRNARLNHPSRPKSQMSNQFLATETLPTSLGKIESYESEYVPYVDLQDMGNLYENIRNAPTNTYPTSNAGADYANSIQRMKNVLADVQQTGVATKKELENNKLNQIASDQDKPCLTSSTCPTSIISMQNGQTAEASSSRYSISQSPVTNGIENVDCTPAVGGHAAGLLVGKNGVHGIVSPACSYQFPENIEQCFGSSCSQCFAKQKDPKCHACYNKTNAGTPGVVKLDEDLMRFSDDDISRGDAGILRGVHRTSTVISIGPMCSNDSIVRSCSVGYLDLVDAQLVPCDVALRMLRRDAPNKRLVLVSRKTKRRKRNKPQPQLDASQPSSKPPRLRNCGKSKSLDSSDIFPSNEQIASPPQLPEHVEETTGGVNNSEVAEDSAIKCGEPEPPKDAATREIVDKHEESNGHITHEAHTEEKPSRPQAVASPVKLPRSSPSSPAPSKKGKRPASASPIRRRLLSSPLLNRRMRKSRGESSDEEGLLQDDSSSTSYRDLETFQKAQLRQKLKQRGAGISKPEAIKRDAQLVMHNKAPMWNESSQVYQLDFGGRVTQESAKNFQIEFRGRQVMQFGRIDGNAYTLDFQYPFSALQAFAVALANVTQRLK
ncbi:tubby-related protein 4-like protein [Lasius niger]|uniref:Tubby-related protein 4-like protein n=1 Tax=Lasius niger TaxID=67767 RepID=A0A0J7L714_LASNI|nr:tubby-related protein 4-like protein [Lasius niger]